MKVVYGIQGSAGWHPITHMTRLLAELLQAELITVPLSRPRDAFRRLAALGPRRPGSETCLIVAAEPRQLSILISDDYWLRGYKQVAGWVIESVWIDRIPLVARRHFDRLFVADKEVVGDWSAATDLPVTWLPMGADVLRLGSDNPDRRIDLRRVGRQPATWEDDEATQRACRALGLRFEGRPPMAEDATSNESRLMKALSDAKFVLAFSNAASPAPYTHPTREYLTARWPEGLASGATVAGIAPRCAATTELLWPGATLELGTIDRDLGIEQIAAAVSDWSPETARENNRRAMERFDWRWRFGELAAALDIQSSRLDEELELLQAALYPVA